MDPEKKKQEDEKAEKEYEQGWDEAGKTLEGDEGLPKEEKPEAPEEEEKVVEPEEKPEAASYAAKATEDKEDPRDKALKDTKAWATRVSMENAELRRTIEESKKGKASQGDVDAQRKAAEDARAGFEQAKEKIYKDYPELKELMDPLIAGFEEMKKTIGSFESDKAKETEEDQRKAALNDYNQNVKPKVLEVHKDFEELLFTKDASGKTKPNDEYFEWAMKQRPALSFAAMDSSDPEDIIWAVTEFKKFKASPEAQAHREKITTEKHKKLTDAGTLRGGSTPFPSVSSREDKEDYDKGWDDAERKLKEQSVT